MSFLIPSRIGDEMDKTVDCLLVTQRGFVFISLPWKQLEKAQRKQATFSEDQQVQWEISSEDGTVYQALDILAKYSVSRTGEDDDS